MSAHFRLLAEAEIKQSWNYFRYEGLGFRVAALGGRGGARSLQFAGLPS